MTTPTLGDVIHNLSRFFTLQRSATKAPRQTLVNPILSDDPPGGPWHAYHEWSEERNERLGLTTAWVYSAIRKISTAALPAYVTIKRRRGDEKEDIPNHPLEVIFQSPNDDMSREYLWTFTHFSMQLSGKAFWFLYPDSRGNIAELWPMPHNVVRPVPNASPNPKRLFSGFIYTFSQGKELMIPADNVVYLRFPHPFDMYKALSPLQAGSLAMLTDRAQAGWNTKTFQEKGGLPTNLISIAPEVNDPDYRQLKADLKKKIGQNMVTRGGVIDVKRLGMTNEEAQYLESRNFNRDEIYEVYGVPAGSNTEAGIKEQNREFINQTVWPYLVYLAGDITTQLVTPFFGPDVFAEFEDIRPQDRALAVQEAVQYWPSYALNETRIERGMKEFKPLMIELDGQKLNLWQDVPTRVIDQLIGKLFQPSPEPPPAPPPGFSGQPSLQDAGSPDANQVLEDNQAANVEDQTPAIEQAPEAKALGINPVYRTWRDIAIERLKSKNNATYVYFDSGILEQDSYAMATALGLCRTEAEIKATFAHREHYTHQAIKAILGERAEIPPEQLALEDDFIPAIEQFLNEQGGRIANSAGVTRDVPDKPFWDNEELFLLAMLTPFAESWTEAGIAAVVTNILTPAGLGIDAAVNARAAEWAGKNALTLARGLNKTTKELAKAKIKNWLQTGAPLSDLETSLAQVIAPPWRASLIASTEVTRAWAEASNQIANEYEVIKGQVWLTANDEIVCPICRPLNGASKSKGGVYPGGYDSPPAHPRCRCGQGYQI